MKKEFLFFLLLTIILGSCDSPRETFSSPQVATKIDATPVPVLTSVHLETFTPLPTKTVKPVATSLPILNSQNPSLIVKDLLETNSDCILPCWWGVIPGRTKWDDTYNSLSPIANSVYENKSENSTLTIAAMFFPAPYPLSGEFTQVFQVKNDVVEHIEILPQRFSKYSLPEGLLQEFGNPEMIFLGGSIDQPQSFQLVLYYPSRGIFALYSNELRPFQQQEILNVCFTEIEIKYVDIFLWDPAASFSETLEYIFTEYERPFYEIELVTDLTISEFSNLFKSVSQPDCFQTPSNFWLN